MWFLLFKIKNEKKRFLSIARGLSIDLPGQSHPQLWLLTWMRDNALKLPCSSVIHSCLTLCYSMNCIECQTAVSPTPRAFSDSCLWSWWCHPTILSSVFPFSSHLQSFPASGSFPVSQFFTSGGQSVGASALASVLPMNIQGWFPLGLTGLLALLSNSLSGVFPSPTIRNHQFFTTQPVNIGFNLKSPASLASNKTVNLSF